jgi:hypothetical protein
VQHEPALVVRLRAERPPGLDAPGPAQAATQGAVVGREAGEPPRAPPGGLDQDAALEDLLQDLARSPHVRSERPAPAGPGLAQPGHLGLLLAQVHLVALKLVDPGLRGLALLLRRLQLGQESVHVVAHRDGLGQLGLGGGQLGDGQEEVLALGPAGVHLVGVRGRLLEVFLELGV